MLKNYLLITWKVLKRKRLYTFVTILGIVIPVCFIVLISSFLVHLNNYIPPKSNFRNVVFLEDVVLKEIKDNGEMNQRTGHPPTLSFINKYVKTLNIPQSVAVISNKFIPGPDDIIYLNYKPNEVIIKYSDSGFWEITDFNFIHGRSFNNLEFEQAERLAVIDEKTSNKLFGITNTVGENIEIKGISYKICGVVKNVDITMNRLMANIYIPYSCSEDYLSDYKYANPSMVLARINNTSDLNRLNEEFTQKLKTFSFEGWGNLNRIEAKFVQDNYIKRIEDLALAFMHFYGNVKKPLYLSGALLFFFFIILPAINLVNININRVYERMSEIGVRKTFGATKRKLSRQFLFENIVLILAGGILSIILSGLIIIIFNKADVLSGIYLRLNFKAVGISLLAIFILGLLSGLMPSISMAKKAITDSLSGSDSKNIKSYVLKGLLKGKQKRIMLVIELFFSFIAFFFILSFIVREIRNTRYPLGFEYRDLYRIEMDLPRESEVDPMEIMEFIRTYPGVKELGRCMSSYFFAKGFMAPSQPFKGNGKAIPALEVNQILASDEIAEVLDLNIIKGRWFNKEDNASKNRPVVLTANLKERLFGNSNALGKIVEYCGQQCIIVGISDNIKHKGDYTKPDLTVFIRKVQEPDLPYEILISMGGTYCNESYYIKCNAGRPASFESDLIKEVRRNYPGCHLKMFSMEETRQKYIRNTWLPFITILLVITALFLNVLFGLFGVLWYNISQRKSEIGLRMAAGANKGHIYRQFLKEVLLLATIAIVPGIIVAIQFPLLNLFNMDTLVYIIAIVAAALIIYALVIICALLPGSRATRIQPAVALHEE